MMWKRLISLCLAIAVLTAVSSCSPDERTGRGEQSLLSDVSVAFLKSLYNGYPYPITEDYRISGMVTSTDRFGNHDRTLTIEDATGGIEVRINRTDLFLEFAPGDLVEVYCNSLTLGGYGRLVQLGTAPTGGYEAGMIPWDNITEHIRKTGISEEAPAPLELKINEIGPAHLSRRVVLRDVQFVGAESALLWCEDGGDTDRTLTDRSGNELAVRTSGRASFASDRLPHGSGYIEGILSWFNDKYQLRVVDPRYVGMAKERF